MKKWFSAVLACALGSLVFFLVSATTEEVPAVVIVEAPPPLTGVLPRPLPPSPFSPFR